MPTTPKPRVALERSLTAEIAALIEATRAVTEHAVEAFHPELRPEAFRVARWLYDSGPGRPSAAAKELGLQLSLIGDTVIQLKKLGLAVGERDPSDRRGLNLTLTAEGTKRVRAVLTAQDAALVERTAGWTDAQLRDFTAGLARFTGAHAEG